MTFRPWGCPKCKHRDSLVRDTAHDEDHYVVRYRKCTKCGTCWSTEERPIEPSAYWGRSHSRRLAQQAAQHRHTNTCVKCGVIYHRGDYSTHVAHSTVHYASMKPAGRDLIKRRLYGREWARRKHKEAA